MENSPTGTTVQALITADLSLLNANLVATLDGYARTDLDACSPARQQRAPQALSEGRFGRSVVPFMDVPGTVLRAHDKHIRPDPAA